MSKSTSNQLITLGVIAFCLLAFVGCTNTVTNSNQEPNLSQSNSQMNESKVNKYSQAPDTLSADQLVGRQVKITTSRGEIVVDLYGEEAPKTVSNFLFLISEQFYDGLTIHRVEPGFVIQGGDPAGNGTGGPGYTVPAEIGLPHMEGSIAMARLSDAVNPDKNSSGSQFYIALQDLPQLDGEYTVFGQVTAGMDVVKATTKGDTIIKIEIIK